MKSSFDAFTKVFKQCVKGRRILLRLVGAFARPDTVAPGQTHIGLPLVAKKAFVGKDVTILDATKNSLRRLALLQVSWYQVVADDQARQRRQAHQFVAEVVHLPCRTIAIGCPSRKIRMSLAARVAHDRHRLGIQQQLSFMLGSQKSDPLTAQFFQQSPQTARASVVLALGYQLRKLSRIVGPDVTHKLSLSRIRYKLLYQHQRQHLA